MNKKILKGIGIALVLILLIVLVSAAVDFNPNGNINMRGLWSIKNATSVEVISNITFTSGGYMKDNGTTLILGHT